MSNPEVLAVFQSLKQAMGFLDQVARERRITPIGEGKYGLTYLVDGKEMTIVKLDRTQWRWQVVSKIKEEN